MLLKEEKMKSIQTKIIILFSILFIICTVIISCNIYFSFKQLVVTTIGTQAKNIAEKSVEYLDMEKYEQLLLENEETDYYYELREKLNEIKEMNGLLYLFTMNQRKNSDGEYEYYYVVDGAPLDDEEASAFGEVEKNYYETMALAFETQELQVGEFTVDEYGVAVSSYVPLKNDKGEFIGILGADFDAEYIKNMLDSRKRTIILFTIVSLIVVVFIIYFATKILISPLRNLAKEMAKVREGDFTVQLKSNRKDEVGLLTHAFNEMVKEIKSMISTIKNSSHQLAVSSEELSSTAEQTASSAESVTESVRVISDGADRQQSIVSDAVKSIRHMSEQLKKISSTLLEVSASSRNANHVSDNGKEKVRKAIQQMEQIKNVQKESSKVISELGSKSKVIDEIVVVITEIADKTNLLALNAAIEAARAGEHGKGFAIVSEEVRKLAEQSAAAAKRISELIKEIQNKTFDAMKTMEFSNEEVEKGTTVIVETGQTFNDINDSIQVVSEQISEINKEITQLSEHGNEVVQVIDEVQSIANQTSDEIDEFAEIMESQLAMVEEVQASIVQLNEMSEQLEQLVEKFKID